MIVFNGLKDDLIGTIKQIHALKGVSVGARLLAQSVFLMSSEWKISWQWFSKELGVSINTIKKWRDELCKAGVWEIETNSNLANRTIFFTLNFKYTKLAIKSNHLFVRAFNKI